MLLSTKPIDNFNLPVNGAPWGRTPIVYFRPAPVSSDFMDITDFTTEQRKALLDLVVLTMYMDGFLASFEAARIQQILTAMGLDSPYDRDKEFDASVTRVRPHSENLEAARICATGLAKLFTTSEQQRRVYDLLSEITESDGNVSPSESKFLASLRNTFRL